MLGGEYSVSLIGVGEKGPVLLVYIYTMYCTCQLMCGACMGSVYEPFLQIYVASAVANVNTPGTQTSEDCPALRMLAIPHYFERL